MRVNRLVLATGFGALLTASFLILDSDAQPGTLKQIVPGVWFREGELLDKGHSNNIIIEMKDYLIVVDANFPSGARLAMADAKRLSPKPVKYVFDTHHHGDHAYGNPVWTKAGATTLAHIGVLQELKRYEPAGWLAAAKSREDVRNLDLTTAEPPMETFEKSPYVLNDGKRKVEFHHFGWAHTRGDGFVYLPKEKILCTGDAAVNGAFNFTGQGNIKNWPSVLRAALKLKPQYVLPGHGMPGDKTLIEGQIDFLEELEKAVQNAANNGKKLDDLVTKGPDGKLTTSVTLSENVSNWVGNGFASQVKDAFEEIAEGKPHGEIVGGK
jgi:glyoxylase-like metal-dependent hydrolase (beta-lactamase superfamily II)